MSMKVSRERVSGAHARLRLGFSSSSYLQYLKVFVQMVIKFEYYATALCTVNFLKSSQETTQVIPTISAFSVNSASPGPYNQTVLEQLVIH